MVLSTSTIILEYVCPSLGLITGNIMFFAPFQDTYRASTSIGSLGSLNPTPWIFMLGNCYGWVLYGILLQNLFIYFANAPGFLLSIWLNIQAVKLLYGQYRTTIVRQSIVTALNDASRPFMVNDSITDNKEEHNNNKDDDDDDQVENDITTNDIEKAHTNRIIFDNNNNNETTTLTTKKMNENGIIIQPTNNNNNNNNTPTTNRYTDSSGYLIVDYAKIIWDVTAQNTSLPPHHHETGVLITSIIWLIITSILAFGEAITLDTKKLIVGFAVNINLIFFYGAPLSTIYTVLTTRSCSTIHVPTMITNTFNGIFWAAYGFAVMNLFILIPNAIGAVTGIIQIILCFLFPRK